MGFFLLTHFLCACLQLGIECLRLFQIPAEFRQVPEAAKVLHLLGVALQIFLEPLASQLQAINQSLISR